MPQLDRITYMSQVIWLIVTLILIYSIVVREIMPGISMTRKIREEIIRSEDKKEETSKKLKELENYEIKIIKIIK